MRNKNCQIISPENKKMFIRMAQYLSYVLPYDEFVPSRASFADLTFLWMEHGKEALEAVSGFAHNDPEYRALLETAQRETLRQWGFVERDDYGFTDVNGNRISSYKRDDGTEAFYFVAIQYNGFTGAASGTITTFYDSMEELINEKVVA